MTTNTDNFFDRVYEVVKKIPYGRVTNYGSIAKYLGSAKSSRAVGYAMNAFGPEIFFVIIALLMATLAIYAGYRMTQRETVSDTSSYAAVLPKSTGVAVEIA